MGHLLTANNHDPLISRNYYPNGQVATDESDIRTWATIAAGGNFTRHVYRDSVSYDLDGGREDPLRVPRTVAPTLYASSTPLTDITYSYDPITGGLGGVHDMMGSNFSVLYTRAGQTDHVVSGRRSRAVQI